MPHAYIAYDRGLSAEAARALFHALRAYRIDAFMETRRSLSYFDIRMIRASVALLLVLTPGVALRLLGPAHPLRAEILTAVEGEMDIIPVLAHGFDRREHALLLPDDLRWLLERDPIALAVQHLTEAAARIAARIHAQHSPDMPLAEIAIEDRAVLRRRTARLLRRGPPTTDEIDAESLFDRASAAPPDRSAQAIADLDRAIALRPSFAAAYVLRGLLRFRSEGSAASAAALRDFDTAIALCPTDAIAYNNRGLIHRARGDLHAARRDYDQAVRLLPGYAGALVNRGLIQRALGDSAAALADFDAAVIADPDFAPAYIERGLLRRSLGDLEGAAEDYEQAIALAPDSAVAYNNRGALRHATGDSVGALADYEQAIALDPDLAEAYLNRGRARIDRALQPPGDRALLRSGIDDLKQYLRLGAPAPHERTDIERLIADLTARIR